MQTKPTCTFHVQITPPSQLPKNSIVVSPNIRKDKGALKDLKAKIMTIANKREDIHLYGDVLSQKARMFLLRELEGVLREYEKYAVVSVSNFPTFTHRILENITELPNLVSQLQIPHVGEGFASISIISPVKWEESSLQPLISAMADFDQCNSHHTETVLQHGISAADYLGHMGVTDEAFLCAAILHDCGKLHTQTFDSEGEAHYYDHQNAGVFLLLAYEQEIKKLYSLSDEDFLQMLYIVNYHMRPHQWKESSHARKRDERIFPPEFIRKLELFHEADKYRPAHLAPQLSNFK